MNVVVAGKLRGVAASLVAGSLARVFSRSCGDAFDDGIRPERRLWRWRQRRACCGEDAREMGRAAETKRERRIVAWHTCRRKCKIWLRARVLLIRREGATQAHRQRSVALCCIFFLNRTRSTTALLRSSRAFTSPPSPFLHINPFASGMHPAPGGPRSLP